MQNVEPMFISDKHVYAFVNVHDGGVLFAQWSAAVSAEGVWSF